MKHEMLEVDLTNLNNWAFNRKKCFDILFQSVKEPGRYISGTQSYLNKTSNKCAVLKKLMLYRNHSDSCAQTRMWQKWQIIIWLATAISHTQPEFLPCSCVRCRKLESLSALEFFRIYHGGLTADDGIYKQDNETKAPEQTAHLS